MAFNKVNQMKRIWVIQEYYKERNKEGVPSLRIIQDINLIYSISSSSFYNWLGVNARKALKEANIEQSELDDMLRRFKEAIKS